MYRDEAIDSLPDCAQWSCSFGNPGDTFYSEYWRDSYGRRWLVAKLSDDEWSVTLDQPATSLPSKP